MLEVRELSCPACLARHPNPLVLLHRPGIWTVSSAGAAPAPERKRPARARPAKAAAAPARGGTKPAAAPAAKGGARRVAGGGQARDGSLAAGKRIEELSTQVTELRLSVDGLEKERDFYL